MVSRPRLHERIAQGVDSRLTFISAPAGFGKTTLLAEWVATTSEARVGWVSLDPADDDPAMFWSYLLAALATVSPDLGGRSRTLLESPQPPPIAAVLTPLINELAAEQSLVLVLDDYHVINAPAVHEGIGFLIDHMPPALHLVLASRSEPPLSLARLRARRQLTEIRSPDLRFTVDEATAFLVHVMGLELSSTQVTKLEERTEGWIAGLQLAALSLQNRADVGGFMAEFAGDNRHIADYLVEEVLQRQPELLRSFLLDTCILDRLTGPLCDAVTGSGDGTELLGQLEKRSLFIITLDDSREWYRYHHLFADVLRMRSEAEDGARVRLLHRRASEWHHAYGTPGEAVHHALAAEDLPWAARIIELAWPAMERRNQSGTWLGWVRELPDELVRVRPVLGIGYAWALLNGGELEAAEARLRDVERWLASSGPGAGPEAALGDVVVADEEQLGSLPTSLATARAYLAQARGDVPDTIRYARRVLDILPEEDHYARAPAGALLGLAYWASGELEAAYRTFGDSMTGLEKAGDPLSAIGGSCILGDIRVAQGRLGEAAAIYDRSLRRAARQATPAFPGVEELHLGLSELHRERNNLDAADQHVASAREAVEHYDWPRSRYRICIAMARTGEARGDLDDALRLLDEAEHLHVRGPLPDVRAIGALKARLLIARGRLEEAGGWAADRGLAADDELAYMREFEHVTLARLLIARYVLDRAEPSLHAATGLLKRLLEAAEAGGRAGSVIEILMLQALAHQARAAIPQALDPLKRALALAEPEEYFRMFVDEGVAMRDLLRHAVAAGIGGAYARRLLAGCDNAPAGDGATSLARPLTPREVEIMRLIAAGLRTPEISDRLFISPATVKRHIANAYDKLEVSHRVAALARADELNLL
jgi:LuxR family maltose regulon positive regulatory protein